MHMRIGALADWRIGGLVFSLWHSTFPAMAGFICSLFIIPFPCSLLICSSVPLCIGGLVFGLWHSTFPAMAGFIIQYSKALPASPTSDSIITTYTRKRFVRLYIKQNKNTSNLKTIRQLQQFLRYSFVIPPIFLRLSSSFLLLFSYISLSETRTNKERITNNEQMNKEC